ncbi:MULTISPECIES: hypothetical protein [Paraburkholderia]|uniref:Lipoprotein n=1 Tax=Paraburkholderia dioscoreae TaxID=2604047 RepID=A0A5Q4Z1R2_9BURK|nr:MULTISPECIES: hypothetical protein [Paraburkholderia]MDR8400325.1 hypothetical protein [Paraburkholderia sp. USG1]VVD27432.1 conserved exported protein of unknown function [Paraburkholderia dioscoreae]
MLKRTVSTAFVGLSVATLSPCTVAETNQEFYSRNGTTLPRAIASYPGGVPYGVSSDPRHAQYGFRPPGITEGSSAVTSAQEARGNFERRFAADLEAYDQARRTRDNPEIRFNIAPREMPKPVTAK